MSLPTGTATRFGFVRRYPFDLALVSAAAIVSSLGLTTLQIGSELRLLLALPLLLFLPGYAFVSVLFPTRARRAHRDRPSERFPRGIDLAERLALSVALSLAIAPLVTIGLAPSQWGLNAESAAAVLGVATVGLAQIGVVRRVRIPEPDRYTVTAGSIYRRIRPDREGGLLASVTSLLLVVAVVGAIGALLFALVSPPAAGGFTELGVYTEDEGGDLVADEYPDELAPGESTPLVVTVDNQEGEEAAYTVVVQEQRLEDDEVVERTELDRIETTVADGDTERIDHDLSPTASDGTVRVVYLLYEGDVPANPTIENADEDVFVWVTVADGSADDGTESEG